MTIPPPSGLVFASDNAYLFACQVPCQRLYERMADFNDKYQ